jgi:hypothetical protein
MKREIALIGFLAATACGSGKTGFDTTSDGAVADGNDEAATPFDAGTVQFQDSSAPIDASAPMGCNLATIGTGGSHASTQFEAWLSQGGVGSLGDQTISASLLAPFSVLIVQNLDTNHVYTAAEAQALYTWVESGGNVMTLTGYGGGNEPSNVNTLIAPFDMQYATNLVLCGCGVPLAITDWVSHPITSGITSVGFDNGYEVVGTAGTILASQSDTSGNHHVLRAATVGSGHIVVWGDEWISYDTVWQDFPQTLTFWQNVIDWFNPQAGCVVPKPN